MPDLAPAPEDELFMNHEVNTDRAEAVTAARDQSRSGGKSYR